MEYTFYVDESGDSGISHIRTENTKGASPYMTMGGVLIPNKKIIDLTTSLVNFLKSITNKSSLHCTNLNHEQKVRFAQFLNEQRLLCFGVISLKRTLGDYKKDISSNNCLYYNKCAQYLLERLGLFLKQKNIPKEKVQIIFEEGNFDYKKLKILISKCQKNPIHKNSEYLKNIDINNIQIINKKNDPLLQLPDLVAHSLYRAVYGETYNVCEYRYVKEFRSKFFKGPNDKVIGNGIYAVHSIKDLSLDKEIKEFFKTL